MTQKNIYTLGGTVQAGTGIYLAREADDTLLELCRNGEFAYILIARQMGKSSLMMRTAERLGSEGVATVKIDLSSLGTRITQEQWYMDVVGCIEDELDLNSDAEQWWDEQERGGLSKRFMRFLEEVVLKELDSRLVIFIDEVDTAMGLDFADDFFVALRAMHNSRADIPVLSRLSFVLIGVATPGDLIKDRQRTPFNIGKRLDLNDFTESEAMPFADGLGLDIETSREVLGWILEWTNGHPYLTQKLCREVSLADPPVRGKSDVDRIVHATFFDAGSGTDSNLQFVSDMLLNPDPERYDKLEILSAYRDILRQRKPPVDGEQQPEVTYLKLAGVVKRSGKELVVRNQLYREMFDHAWIREHWPVHWIKTVPKPVWALVASLVLVAVLSFLYANAQIDIARTEKISSERDRLARLEADSLRQIAEDERRRAIEAAELAKANESRANQAAALATMARDEAERLRITAEYQARQTKISKENAEQQAAKADSARKIAEDRRQVVERFSRIALARLLTNEAQLRNQAGNDTLAVLLAAEAWRLNAENDGLLENEVYNALRQTLNVPAFAFAGGPTVLENGSQWIRKVKFHPSQEILVTAGDDAVIRIWDAETGAIMKELALHSQSVKDLIFVGNGDHLLSAGNDGQIIYWQDYLEIAAVGRVMVQKSERINAMVADDQLNRLVWLDDLGRATVATIRSGGVDSEYVVYGAGELNALALHPTENQLITADIAGKIDFWAFENGGMQHLRSLNHFDQVNSLAISSDGHFLLSGGYDKRILRWNLRDLQQAPTELLGHRSAISDLALSANDRYLASASTDRTVRLWDLENLRQHPVVLEEHTAKIWSLDLSPDGRRLISGAADRRSLLWTLPSAELRDRVCRSVQRNLTSEEWEQYIGETVLYNPTCAGSAASMEGKFSTSGR